MNKMIILQMNWLQSERETRGEGIVWHADRIYYRYNRKQSFNSFMNPDWQQNKQFIDLLI